MTNEEKAMEISSHRTSLDYEIMAYDGALEMAEWKDQQFKEYLERKKVELPAKRYLSDFEVGVIEGKEFMLDEIINELFNEVQNEH